MINHIKNWLYKPYPFPSKLKIKFIVSFTVAIFILLYLLVFQPFGFNDLSFKNRRYFAFLYALNTFVVFILNFIFFPFIFKTIFNINNWTIFKMIVFVLEIMVFIAVLNWLIADYSSYNTSIIGSYSLLFFIGTSFLIGIFPLLIYLFVTERFMNSKNSMIAKNVSINNEENSSNDLVINKIIVSIKGENKKEDLTLFLHDLIYISAEKNYVSIFHLNNTVLKETVIRSSLSKLEKQLSNYNTIVRCHKSFIVNTNKVQEIKGNARNYLLKVDRLDFLIPVSRSFPRELLFTLIKK